MKSFPGDISLSVYSYSKTNTRMDERSSLRNVLSILWNVMTVLTTLSQSMAREKERCSGSYRQTE
jgi:hypothetical protein